ncbi:unnamed protein product [Acanthoscelides obtectus]|uniref:Peptidase metallopeptidase domain-containing protein n=1 Tax=Acanthoscelides obtectus TaxID=200917 RepID=A0A9P0VUW0_ACAOB|nr:unnamed protein product [Acanthoscelides obtectus]CAK1685849.1 Matrix metalloproteinase-16 [Acanthoscelides obtectus]
MVTNPTLYPPDITITMVSKTHYFSANCMGNDECPLTLDDAGGVLGHAYFPDSSGTCREIHLDINERWYFGNNPNIPKNQTSFLMVLVHEIGHALGIAHSASPNAIMFAFYQHEIRGLDVDDINAVQYLYGRKNKYDSIPKSTTASAIPKTTTTIRSTTRKQPILKNLCDIIPDFMFLAIAPEFSNYRLYIAHDMFIWKLDLNEMIIPSQPELLVDYVPTELRQYTLQHIFQSTNGDLITIVSPNNYFSASFPTIKFLDNFSIDIPDRARINAIFQSNAGRSYTFYNNMSYIEFSNDFTDVLNRGRIRDIFPELPEDISLAFRWIDGHIYFFRHATYYKFNEFTRKVVATGPFHWTLFGVPCPSEDLLHQLKTLLSKLVSVYH